MDEILWALMNIVGPAILLILLIWLVMRSRRRTGQTTDTTAQTEAGTRAEYADEERRRRDGTDGL
jgi:membrane protein implicated in regulation of membrane protease activity